MEGHIELLRSSCREKEIARRAFEPVKHNLDDFVKLLECRIDGTRKHPPDGRVFDESEMEIDLNEEVISRIIRHGDGVTLEYDELEEKGDIEALVNSPNDRQASDLAYMELLLHLVTNVP